jgi:lysozyme family protein
MYISKALSWTPSPATTQPGPAPAAQAAGRFLICLPDTLIQECPLPTDWSNAANFSDDPHDPGGATMCGIIQVEYDAYRKSLNEPAQSVRSISQAEGYAIYQANYWQPHCPQLQAGLDLSFFDSAVNMGAESIKILQFVLGIDVDGAWGPQTATAVAGITDVVAVIKAYTARRQAVYQSFSTYTYFGPDWTRRTTQIGNQSLAMATAPAMS